MKNLHAMAALLMWLSQPPLAQAQAPEQGEAATLGAQEQQQWSGQLSIVGSQRNARVVLRDREAGGTQRICPGAKAEVLAKLAGMTVTVAGQVPANQEARRPCIEVQHFAIDLTTTGRPAAVGILEKDEQGYLLRRDSSETRLTRVLPGMEHLVGKKVILSLEAEIGLHGAAIQPMSYMAYP